MRDKGREGEEVANATARVTPCTGMALPSPQKGRKLSIDFLIGHSKDSGVAGKET